jgi:hypothetical protein
LQDALPPNFKISNGDYFLTLTFRSDADQIGAGLYLAAAMILSFTGYGFGNQAETHGGRDFAEQLLAESANAAAFDGPPPAYPLASGPETAATPTSIMDRFLGLFRPK